MADCIYEIDLMTSATARNRKLSWWREKTGFDNIMTKRDVTAPVKIIVGWNTKPKVFVSPELFKYRVFSISSDAT